MLRSRLALFLSISLLSLSACGGGDSDSQDAAGTGGAASTTASAGGATSASTTAVTVSTGSSGGGQNLDPGMISNVYPAFKPSMPQVVTGDGPELTSPEIYPIFFANDDPNFDTQVESFVTAIGPSAYWADVVTEYGVGAATGNPGIYVTDMAPSTTTDDAIQTYLAGKLNAMDPQFPVPDANTLLAVFYPATTTITEGGQQSCVDFGGYHNSFTLASGQNVAYAVLPRCDNFDGFSGIDAVTAGASHEFVEAATDPFPDSQFPGYVETDPDHIYWTIALGGGEIGDMCAQSLSSFGMIQGFPFTVQRMWSNQAAAAYHDPCVPAPSGDVYFNTSPVLPDKITLGGGFGTVHGVKIPVGQSRTVELDLWSDGDTGGPWEVHADDESFLTGGPRQLGFQFENDNNMGRNGQKLYVTITVNQASQYKAEVFYLRSRLNQTETLWVGFIGN